MIPNYLSLKRRLFRKWETVLYTRVLADLKPKLVINSGPAIAKSMHDVQGVSSSLQVSNRLSTSLVQAQSSLDWQAEPFLDLLLPTDLQGIITVLF